MIPWIWFVYCCSLSDSSLPKHWTCLEPEPSESKLAVRHTHYLWLSCQLVISHSSLKLMMPKTNVVNLPVTQLCFLCSHLFLISSARNPEIHHFLPLSFALFHFHLFWSLGSLIFYYFLKEKNYLTAPGLSSGMWTFSCSMWDLVHCPGIEPRPPALGAWHLSPWTTREILILLLNWMRPVGLPLICLPPIYTLHCHQNHLSFLLPPCKELW